MNEAAWNYWLEYWGEEQPPDSVSAGQFGDEPDYLAGLVINGTKTATCYGYQLYEIEKVQIPTVGDYSIILNKKDEPVAITQITKVEIKPLNEVDEAFAIAEGDGSYENWYTIHKRYFTEKLREVGMQYKEDMLLVCQTIKLIDSHA
ncbi:ASCH domain-containing protein [Alkalicoccobacillus murimartini]|uniref:Uncharacterized protein YhfF n=1 Tax=Alkalicoccobacillus murimartini TaxID=171685 RepID=A0ABT9YLN8_9BACI|nr:ASCH domain-containing protein [Alkalicoccobacillus murimartini]MDQ0208795.1 uncharacterized protein YhfF [Alkalicoccobacillus murimartini]